MAIFTVAYLFKKISQIFALGKPCKAFGQQREAQQDGSCAQNQVTPASRCGSEADDDRALVAAAVLLPVAEIVNHEHRVDHHAAGQSDYGGFSAPPSALEVVGESDGNQAEEKDDGYVAHTVIGQRPRACRVKIGEDNAGGTHQQEPPVPAAEGQQSRSGCTGRQSESRDTALHRPQGDVAFGESAVGTQSVGAVGSLQKVAEIIDQIGRTLHRHGEDKTQQSDDRAEAAVGEGQGRSDENEDDGIPQTVRPDGQNPCGE